MNDLDRDIKKLKENLLASPNKVTEQLILLLKETNVRKDLYFKSLLLRNNFIRMNNERLSEGLYSEYSALFEELFKQKITSTSSRRDPVKIRIPSKVVFKGINVGKIYRSFKIEGINLILKTGEITALVGENASGKSTLIKIISGFTQHDTGELSYPEFGSNWAEIRKKVAYVGQELPSWGSSFMLEEILSLECAIHGISGEENELMTQFIIQRLNLQNHLYKRWEQLSGGYKLRFELARALVWRPSLLILDEPLANLDINAQNVILEDLKDMCSSSRYPIAILISSQHLAEIERIADNLIFLKNGMAIYSGRLANIEKNRTYNLFEIECNIATEEVRAIIKNKNIIDIHDRGGKIIIKAEKSVTQKDILSLILENNVSIKSFRDLTSSSIKLFYENLD